MMEAHVKNCIKSNIRVILCGTGAILLIFAVLISLFCFPARSLPEEGEWYCEDLNMKLSFSINRNTLLSHNGEEVLCIRAVEHGSTWIDIICDEIGNPNFAFGEAVFSGEILKLKNNLFIIQSSNGVEYTFRRING